jgi:prolyl-tRNA editing enzyme YbaK/EbsC (Cys-tRNA(Pro) deacylase)
VYLSALRDALAARSLRLAYEVEFQDLFPDSDVGAISRFANLYEVSVCAKESLACDDEIVFPTGTHEDSICMRCQVRTIRDWWIQGILQERIAVGMVRKRDQSIDRECAT